MNISIEKTIEQVKILLLIGITILIGQKVKMGSNMILLESIPGMFAIMFIALVSLKIKELIPKMKIPAFAWASLIGLLLSMPASPISESFLSMTSKVDFLAIGTCILAVAGISVGNKLTDLKKMSWKILIIAFIVFIGTFFGSAIISQIILKAQGII